MKIDFIDILVIVGVLLVGTGLWMFNPAYAFLGTGSVMLFMAWSAIRGRPKGGDD